MSTDQVRKIEKGVTTQADITRMIGSPMSVGFDGNGNKTATWFYTRAESHGTNFIPIYGAFDNKMDMHQQMLMVIFNSDGTVKDYNFNDSNNTVKAGLAN